RVARGPLLRPGDGRRHDLLAHRGGVANRTADQAAALLVVEIGGRAEPPFELVAVVAGEGVADHSRTSGPEKLRAFFSAGIAARAFPTSAGSSSAKSTPGSSWSSFPSTSPHGPTAIVRPQVPRPSS